jgi:hypothetical protein
MAALDGDSTVFGIGVTCTPPAINPRRDQKANYPALNGTESLDMGDQGAYSTVSGRLTGGGLPALGVAIGNLLAFYDGQAHLLTDNVGLSWPNVKMESIEWEKGQIDPDNGYSMRFTCRFFHLTLG